jgi:hypothetical protein
MKAKQILLFSAVSAAMLADAAWYWPFGGDENVAPRISELMEPATELIDAASDLAEQGKDDEAIAEYRAALIALARIEAENPDRADKPEFATLRNKRAYVEAAIDSLQLDQARRNAKPVAITDTTELEKRYKAKKDAERMAGEPPAATPAEAEGAAAEKEVSEAIARRSGEKAPAEPEAAPKAAGQAVEADEAPSGDESEAVLAEIAAAKEALAANPGDRRAKLRMAIADLKAGDYDSALLSIREVLSERPNDAAALNLRASIESEKGDMASAEKTLDQCIRSNPRSPYAYYNMARLILETRGKSGVASAKRYYENSLLFGGAKDEDLERSLLHGAAEDAATGRTAR